jgi:hypothetical protein
MAKDARGTAAKLTKTKRGTRLILTLPDELAEWAEKEYSLRHGGEVEVRVSLADKWLKVRLRGPKKG